MRLKRTGGAADKDEWDNDGCVGKMGRILQMTPDCPARRRAAIGWCLALQALAWPLMAAQIPPRTQQVDEPVTLPALPLEPDEGHERVVLPTVPVEPPRPRTGSGSVSSFVQGLKGNDAIVEVVLGQGRILTTRSDMSGQGGKAVIALGDPSVMDFVVLSPRQLRLVGRRLGTTDLSITATDGQIFNFEVHVVADLTLLEMRLKALFPDASLTISQASGNIVIEGQARSPAQVSRIIQIVTTHVSGARRFPLRPDRAAEAVQAVEGAP